MATARRFVKDGDQVNEVASLFSTHLRSPGAFAGIKPDWQVIGGITVVIFEDNPEFAKVLSRNGWRDSPL